MTARVTGGSGWRGPAVTVLALLGVGLAAARAPAMVLVNESASLPRGLYLRAPLAAPVRGAVVAAPQPPSARAYLAGLGLPPDALLLKRVAATGGDRVCRTDGAVEAAGRRAALLERDRRGVRLGAWSGCRALAADELFLLGDTPTSFDSRYFGPVRIADTDGVFVEVLTW